MCHVNNFQRENNRNNRFEGGVYLRGRSDTLSVIMNGQVELMFHALLLLCLNELRICICAVLSVLLNLEMSIFSVE